MVNLLRQHQQTLLAAITVVVIVSFVLFWNVQQAGRTSLFGGSRGSAVATMYGQPISEQDVQRDARRFRVALTLGLNELLQSLTGNARQNEAVEAFIWNSRVLHHEADLLQIVPSDDAVQKELTSLPELQTNGRFDPAKLALFVHDGLPPLGFTDSVIDDLLRDQVRVKMIRALVGSTVDLSPAELDNRFSEENQTLDASVIRLNTSDLEKNITISDADARKAYDQRKDQLKSEEQRKITIASLELSDADKALAGKQRTAALQKLADAAGDFTQEMLKDGAKFNEVAKKTGAKLATPAPFSASQPDPSLAKTPDVVAAAFKLSTGNPVSDVIEGTNGFYVVHLDDIIPSQPLTFEQAKPAIVAQLTRERATQMLQTEANTVRSKITDALKAGKSFEDAAASVGLKPETIPPFSLATATKVDVPDSREIVGAAITAKEKQLSNPVETASGGLLFVYLRDRKPVDAVTALIGKATSKVQYSQQQQLMAFEEWLRLRLQAARLEFAQR